VNANARLFFLALVAAGWVGCAPGGEGAPGLEIEQADEEGLRASTSIDGERVEIEARAVVEPLVYGADTFDDEYRVARVVGKDGTVYADWRLRLLTDEVTGELGGWPMDEEARESLRSARDWSALAGSRVGAVLSQVSARAQAARGGELAGVDEELALVADMGPYLQMLPSLVDDLAADCGDGVCSVDETDANCPEDCGCAAEASCGGVAPFGCYCSEDCADRGDCCVDACQTCGAGCPACGDQLPCGGTCANVGNVCDGQADCASGEDEARCGAGTCRAGQSACGDGTCVEFYQLCDGREDCPGGDDEVCECAYCDPDR
jgi:hypothetical protein